MNSKPLLARRVQFRCAHLYHQPQISRDENQKIFGACFSPHGHGHTYTLEAYFQGDIDPVTGMILNLTEVDEILNRALEPVRDKHRNFEVAEFKTKIPTTENLALFLKGRIEDQIKTRPARLSRLRLYESDSLWVDIIEERPT